MLAESIRFTNDWLHDIASGLWAGCLIVLYVLEQQRPLAIGSAIDAWHVLASTSLTMFRVLLASLLLIAVTGIIRLVARPKESAADKTPRNRAAFIGRHVAYVLIYGAGTVWAYTLVWPR